MEKEQEKYCVFFWNKSVIRVIVGHLPFVCRSRIEQKYSNRNEKQYENKKEKRQISAFTDTENENQTIRLKKRRSGETGTFFFIYNYHGPLKPERYCATAAALYS